MKSKEVAVIAGVSWIAARKWAKNNGVQKKGRGKGYYDWTDYDVARYLNRPDGRRRNG